jgi:hypothetical protein
MAKKTVLVQNQVQAMNIDALNRSAVYTTGDIENGQVFRLDTLSTTDGESEDWVVTAPATGKLNGLWMAYSPENVTFVVEGNKYRGLTPDPRIFTNVAGEVFSAYKPQVGDIILMSVGGAFENEKGASDVYVNASDAKFGLTWGTTQTASALSFKLLEVSYISIADGSIGTQRTTAYRLECVAN